MKGSHLSKDTVAFSPFALDMGSVSANSEIIQLVNVESTFIVKMSSFCTKIRNARRQYTKPIKWIILLDKLIFLSKGYVKSFHKEKVSRSHFYSWDIEGLNSGRKMLT